MPPPPEPEDARPAPGGPTPAPEHPSGLDADVRLRIGPLDVAVPLTVAPSEVVALLGPNGAGKTTVLRALAGLARLDDGRIALDGRALDEPATGTWVPPERRAIGLVFQDHALFAHLDAAANVAFGLRAAGTSRRRARPAADAWLARVGLDGLADRRPGQLSGGQRQRLALARALAPSPALVLLDEPTAAVDGPGRTALRRDLRRHLHEAGVPAVVVTHDPVEAEALADRVVVVERGTVVQAGAVADLAARPRSTYVADLAGVNLLAGVLVAPGVVRTADGGELHGTPDDAQPPTLAGPALAVVHPRSVALYADPPHGSPRNCWTAAVTEVDARTDRVRVALDGPPALTAEVTAEAASELSFAPGSRVWAVVKATEVRLLAGTG